MGEAVAILRRAMFTCAALALWACNLVDPEVLPPVDPCEGVQNCVAVVTSSQLAEALAGATTDQTVLIAAGTYPFDRSLIASADGLVLQGHAADDGSPATLLDFDTQTEGAGVVVQGDRVAIANVSIHNAKNSGIAARNVGNLIVRNVRIQHAERSSVSAAYGIRCDQCLDLELSAVSVSGASEAGISILDSRSVRLSAVSAESNHTGILVQDSEIVRVQDADVRQNSLGMLLYQSVEGETPLFDVEVSYSEFVSNNAIQSANEDSPAFEIPAGSGLWIVGGRDIELQYNQIRSNNTLGLAVFDHQALAETTAETDLLLDLYVHDNGFAANSLFPEASRGVIGGGWATYFERNVTDPADIYFDLSAQSQELFWGANKGRVCFVDNFEANGTTADVAVVQADFLGEGEWAFEAPAPVSLPESFGQGCTLHTTFSEWIK